MTPRAQIFVVVLAAVGFLGILLLVRRARLKERFALLWLTIGVGMIALVAARPLLDRIADALGIASGTTVLFLVAIFFLLGLMLHLSVTVSTLEEEVRTLAEEVALARADSLEAEAPVHQADERQDEAQPGGEQPPDQP